MALHFPCFPKNILSVTFLLLLSSFTSLGTGRCTQEAEPVQGTYPLAKGNLETTT